MASDGRTEKATPRKKEDERKKGNIFQSKDIASAFSLLLFIFLLKLGGNHLFLNLRRILYQSYGSLSDTAALTVRDASTALADFCINLLLFIIPIGGTAMLLGVAVGGVQTRFLVTWGLLKPKASRLNPLSGIKNIFSKKSIVELLKSIIKVVIIGWVLYTEVSACLTHIIGTPLAGLESSMIWIGDTVFQITVKIVMFMALLGVFDYLYQWWDHEQKLKMTKQEVKEEHKRMEGDPNIKGKIRAIQRKMSLMRMMHKVPHADVVIKNPTHYAVALKYDPQKSKAPVVTAKGADYVALQIIKIAEENGVYVTENKPLARGLYEVVKLDQQIPEEFYKPVADVIAFIYKLKKRR